MLTKDLAKDPIKNMDPEPQRDPDIPGNSRLIGRLHMRVGRLAIGAAARLRRPVSLGVRLLALNARGDILLVRHTYLPGLALPGGAVDPGETTREAAIREAQEEAGLDVTERPDLFSVYLNRALASRDHVLLYVTRNAHQPREPGRSGEILSARFYGLGDLPDDVTPATRTRIAEVLHGAERSDYW